MLEEPQALAEAERKAASRPPIGVPTSTLQVALLRMPAHVAAMAQNLKIRQRLIPLVPVPMVNVKATLRAIAAARLTLAHRFP